MSSHENFRTDIPLEEGTKVRMHVKRYIVSCGIVFVIAILNQSNLIAESTGPVVEKIAGRLNDEQIKSGITKGSWPDEGNFTGSILPGMVSAYKMKCDIDYRRSAEWSGDYILWAAQGNFYGDDICALTRLSQIASDPCDNPWRTVVTNFYNNVNKSIGGTESYISTFEAIEPSTAVFYLANHVVAAYYVDAEDKKLWRKELINLLSRVDDSSIYPVMSLGAATWALAQTGPLDQTDIHSSGEGAPYWESKKLADLPALLMSHQVQDGQPGAGGFYWQFWHMEGSPNGYTEDAIFATRGLIAAYYANPDPNLESAIINAHAALMNGVSSDGKVWERLSQEGSIFYTYGGEMLQVLGELVIPGDLDLDNGVNSRDYAILVNSWYASDCAQYCACYGADLNQDGKVDFCDLKTMADKWLEYSGR
jgi:hypothetical protein